MNIAVASEIYPGETRIALTPESGAKLRSLGAELSIQSGLGSSLGFTDEAYEKLGISIVTKREELLRNADLVLRVRPCPLEEIALLKPGAIHISYLDPFNQGDLTAKLAAAGIRAISMEMIPRTTLAQKMDALSSQASLAGYVAVILAAQRLHRIFPMMMTPAGTINPANVFILGAGVAGLQAIATAKRLGARVSAFDIRPSSALEVESLGARFLKIDIGELEQTKDGYAKELSAEQLAIQKEGQAKACAASDIVITTAQIFGRKAPVLINKETIERMKKGSIIVDMAVESGGNVELSRMDEEVDVNGVTIIGYSNLAGHVADHASQMYANNLANLIEHFWDTESKALKLDLEDEILKGCLLTQDGEIVNERLRSKR
ncbi:Re/Si-specific NAD(P)(+) transhydrogenase subunit alpha [Treponema sp.]